MEELANINWGLIAPLIVVQAILMIVALTDLVRIHATNGPKWVWALVIIFANLVGPVIYFIVGRKSS
ncbi:PLD nuclease N-terminal domain-containing protein [Lysinibacillus sp. 3P01SB]|uniref:PLD nuclease N-terminal domain-containing protein n=1 Tax=Lysinibacillus sp. 3P01SB TaxID=3132284 RepID=UPI0039A69EA2